MRNILQSGSGQSQAKSAEIEVAKAQEQKLVKGAEIQTGERQKHNRRKVKSQSTKVKNTG